MDLWARDPSEAMIAEDIRASREKFPRGERYVPPTTQEEADASQTNRVWTRPRREERKAERFRADAHSAPVRSSPQTRVLAGLGEALGRRGSVRSGIAAFRRSFVVSLSRNEWRLQTE